MSVCQSDRHRTNAEQAAFEDKNLLVLEVVVEAVDIEAEIPAELVVSLSYLPTLRIRETV
jgi:hypothetical protein